MYAIIMSYMLFIAVIFKYVLLYNYTFRNTIKCFNCV